MKEDILKCLQGSDDFISGQMLCTRFNVSRTAIWKAISQLREDGYEIEAVKNRGYRLISAPDVVTAREINRDLHTRWAARPVIYYEETDSTNNRLKALAEEGKASHGTVAVAEIQNAGKGRRGRSWNSPKGTNVANSILLKPEISPMNASMLTLVAGLAVCEVLSRYDDRCRIKWPNDIVIGGRKVCGILTEMSTEMDAINYVVVGIGLNINTESFDDSIKDVATSLMIESGRKFKRSRIICELWKAFEDYYDIFVRTEDLSGLKEEYNRHLVNIGRQVMIEERGRKFTGTAMGIDDEGSLIVTLPDGTVRHVISGEVSVRGIYGYV